MTVTLTPKEIELISKLFNIALQDQDMLNSDEIKSVMQLYEKLAPQQLDQIQNS